MRPVEDPTESDTVVRGLDANADVETSYGDNFVDSIDGYAGSTAGGGREDWFFFVNGYYSDIGAGETRIEPGDRIWWDYRYWAAAYRVPAVVGSWPEPFLHGDDGDRARDRRPVPHRARRLRCGRRCAHRRGRRRRRSRQPAEPGVTARCPPGARRPWDASRSDPAAGQIEAGPGHQRRLRAVHRVLPDGTRLTIDDSHGRAAAEQIDAGADRRRPRRRGPADLGRDRHRCDPRRRRPL